MLQVDKPPETGRTALIALGGNISSSVGGPAETVRAAARDLRERLGPVALSPLFRTPCFPAGAGPDFVNAACALQTMLPPRELLATLHDIEAGYGRQRLERWGERTLDLDLIALDQLVLPDAETFNIWRDLPAQDQGARAPDQLILPHPRLQDRAFVLVPLAYVAPDWTHPATKLSVLQMRDALPASERRAVALL